MKYLMMLMLFSTMAYSGEKEKCFTKDEMTKIENAFVRNGGKDPELLKLLCAIRKTENGKDHLAFGIIHEGVNTYDSQAGWAAATVIKNYNRYVSERSTQPFIDYLGKRYAPQNVLNDPSNLNKNWVKNCRAWYLKLGGKNKF